MSHILLIFERPGERAQRSEAQGRELYERMLRFSDELQEEGVLVLSQSLKSEAVSARVSRADGCERLRDGPFAEAKEIVGGFFLLTGTTPASALAIARRCPAAEWAVVEVRELGPCFT